MIEKVEVPLEEKWYVDQLNDNRNLMQNTFEFANPEISKFEIVKS
jgi:hypothetical protein